MSEDNRWQLTPEEIQQCRDVLVVHANDIATGCCPHCAVVTCPAWRAAFDKLALAGEVMAEPQRWDPPAPPGKGRPW